ncbi:MAG: GNAT family N-acetyltransferase [Bacteroidia bacterium]|nr:GNAT family N-acetyltransferase [Bacteroidia bacterium]
MKDFGAYKVCRANADEMPEILKILSICELDARDCKPENFLLAKIGENIVGCIRHKIHPDGVAEICSLGVLPEFRNRGIAKCLFNEKLNELLEQGIKEIYLITIDEKFFLPFGFEIKYKLPYFIEQKLNWCKEHLPVVQPYFAMGHAHKVNNNE